MGVTNHFIIEEELQKIINSISSTLQTNHQSENEIMNELAALESSIVIGSKPVNNKKHEVETNIGLLRKSCEGVKDTYFATINMYDTSVHEAKSYIDKQKSNLGGF